MEKHIALEAWRFTLQQLIKASFPFAELRPKPLDPEECYNGDYDFLYDGRQKTELINHLIASFRAQKIPFLIFQAKRRKLQIHIYDPETGRRIIAEFWSACTIDVSWMTARFASYLTWRDLEDAIVHDGDGFRIKSNIRAILYITHLYAKNKKIEKEQVQRRIQYFKEQCESKEARHELIRELLTRLAKNETPLKSANHSALELLRDQSMFSLSRALWRFGEEKLFQLATKRPRNIMAVVGPDGAGKSTLLKQAIPEDDRSMLYYKFKDLYRKHNGVDKILRKWYGRNKRLKRNQIDEQIFGFHFISSLIVFFFFRILHRKKMIVLDRYFYDLFITGLRDPSAKAAPVPWYNLGLFIAPRPKGLLILDVPYEISLVRKGEIAREDWETIFSNYLNCYFAKPAKCLAWCNTELPLDRCVDFFQSVKNIVKK